MYSQASTLGGKGKSPNVLHRVNPPENLPTVDLSVFYMVNLPSVF